MMSLSFEITNLKSEKKSESWTWGTFFYSVSFLVFQSVLWQSYFLNIHYTNINIKKGQKQARRFIDVARQEPI